MPLQFEGRASLKARVVALLDDLDAIGTAAETLQADATELSTRAIANVAQATNAIHDLAILARKTLQRSEQLAKKSSQTLRLVRELIRRNDS